MQVGWFARLSRLPGRSAACLARQVVSLSRFGGALRAGTRPIAPTPSTNQPHARPISCNSQLAGGTVREYFDLDAPQNNRAVLDYGDL